MQFTSKHFGRLAAVTGNSVFLSLPGLANMLLSLLVIRLFAPEWWGMIVGLQLTYYIVTGICSWGNKEYLLRLFSEQPARMDHAWKQSLTVRGVLLLIPASLVILLVHPGIMGVHVVIWVVLRFFHQSFESIATYQKKFGTYILPEVAALLFMTGSLFFNQTLGFEHLLLIITLGYFIKTIPLLILYKRHLFTRTEGGLNMATLIASSGFMLLAFTGLLQSKTDLLVLNWLMTKKDLAEYQVITGFLLLIKSITSFIIYPFVKNIYRLQKEVIRKTAFTLLKYGVLICVAGLVFQYLILKYAYQYSPTSATFVWGFLFVIPGFWFSPIVFYLFKNNRQSSVVWVNIFGIVVNAILCFFLIPLWGINGALASMAIAQIAMMTWYYIDFNTSDPAQKSA